MTDKPLVSLDDLKFIARIEGRPRARGREIAAELGVSHTSAWRLITRLENKGAIRFETAVRRDFIGGECECVAYLKARLADQGAIDDFEATMMADPRVRRMARIAGKQDYRLQAMHSEPASANAWFRSLLEHPAVLGGELSFIRLLIDRPTYAAAVLGSDPLR